MGLLKISNCLGGAVLGSVIVGLAVTNPDQDAYESYATEQMATYLASEVCDGELSSALGQLLRDKCSTLVSDNQEQFIQIVSDNTVRSNYIIMSSYRTRFEVPGLSLLPVYEFKTVGIGQRFFTYQAGER